MIDALVLQVGRINTKPAADRQISDGRCVSNLSRLPRTEFSRSQKFVGNANYFGELAPARE